MDPITILGAVASVGQLLDQSTKIANSARKVVQSIINAPAEVSNLVAKLDRLKSLLDQIQKFVQEGSDTQERDDLFPTPHRQLLQNCLQSNAEALQALQSLQSLDKTKSLGIKKRVRWATIDKRKAAAIQTIIKDAEGGLDLTLTFLGLRLGSMTQNSLAILLSAQETSLPRLESNVAEIQLQMGSQFASIRDQSRVENTAISNITSNVWDEVKSHNEKLDHIISMSSVSEKMVQTLLQNFVNIQRQSLYNETSKSKVRLGQGSMQPSQPRWPSDSVANKRSNTHSCLAHHPRNIPSIDNITDLDSLVQTRVVEHAMRTTRQLYFYEFRQHAGLLRIDTIKPQLDIKVTVASKRELRKARIILRLGLRLISQHIIQFEVNMRHNARHWMSIPRLGCSFTTVNVRDYDAPIFKACYDWDLDTVRFLIETGQASVYDVNETRSGLLEHVLGVRDSRYPPDRRSLGWEFKGQLVLEYLLEEGCDPNVYHGPFMPATLLAFFLGSMDALSSLLLHGAQLDSFGFNPSSLLRSTVFRSQLQLLRSIGFSDWKVEGNVRTLLNAACQEADLPEVLFALEVAHIDPNTYGNTYTPPAMSLAAASGRVAIATALLESGAAINSGSMSWAGPPLYSSIRYESFGIAHWLLFHGAVTNLTNRHLKTPLIALWERIFIRQEVIEYITIEALLTHLFLHNADPFQLFSSSHQEEFCAPPFCDHTDEWYNHVGQIKLPEYARAWTFDSKLHLRELEPTIERILAYENAEMERKPMCSIFWSQSGIIFKEKSSAPEICLNQGKPGSVEDTKDQGDNLDEISDDGCDDRSVSSDEYSADETSEPDDDKPSCGPTLFYQNISTPEGRAQMSTFPMVRLLCNALQLAGYRAEQDMEGDIWYEDDDGDMYYDAREYQSGADEDESTVECYICKDLEKYGLGYILREEEYGRQKLFEYREKVKEKKRTWF